MQNPSHGPLGSVGRFFARPIACSLTTTLSLSKGRWAQLGLVAGGLFLIAISPLSFDTLPNALLAMGLFYLATKRYDASLWDMVSSRLHGRSPAATV
jgi:hypothetical protein